MGSATADKLARYGIKVDLVPTSTARRRWSAARAAGSLAAVRVLLPRADIGREVVADNLRKGGAAVTEVVAYRTVLEESQSDDGPDVYRMLLDGELQVVTFTSASAVRTSCRIYGAEQAADLLSRTCVATIGPVTTEAAERLGIKVAVQASPTRCRLWSTPSPGT